MLMSSFFRRRRPHPDASDRTPAQEQARSTHATTPAEHVSDQTPPTTPTSWPDGVNAPTATKAIEAFTQAVNAVPIVDRHRALAEYEGLRRVWRGEPIVGSFEEISRTLQANLERDANMPGQESFLIDLLIDDVAAVQVSSLFDRTARAYRVWRTEGSLILFGSHRDMIQSADDVPTRLFAGKGM